MVFKKTLYKIGNGANFRGFMDTSGQIKLYYLTTDPSGIVVGAKIINRDAGCVRVRELDKVIEAKAVVPLKGEIVATRGHGQVKYIAYSEAM